MTRTQALLAKELADLRQNPGLFVPAVLTGLFCLLLPFAIAILLPYLTGERLSDSSDARTVLDTYRGQTLTQGLDPEGAVQAWLFQRFLVLLALTPVAGAMSTAAYSVIGEKQARTLEPLLATPITTVELLVAKVLGSLLPAMALTLVWFALYVTGVALLAQPGVYAVLLTARELAVVLLVCPLSALAALQLAVCMSSRVNDPRSAQQIGVLVILPISGLLVAQLTGNLELTVPMVLLIALLLAVVNVGLMRVAVALFDRESILTRWK